MRGQLVGLVAAAQYRRIIPARAGPTGYAARLTRAATDHPRSCGANKHVAHGLENVNGSSPLVRGQPRQATRSPCSARIIPARAGPTIAVRVPVEPVADHPRSCGANTPGCDPSAIQSGSSPLVRGQLASITRKTVSSRIIPARAGPTDVPSCRAALPPDHPRSCGANSQFCSLRSTVRGSSPLVRGQRKPTDRYGVSFRIIPARAGPTLEVVGALASSTDHPRSCGANRPRASS